MNHSTVPTPKEASSSRHMFPDLIPAIEIPQGESFRPVIIAGPCSAESLEQVLETATALRPLGIAAFRAGIWKPRTHPGGFEGFGTEALEWMAEAKRETGLPTATEIASASHFAEAIRYGIDILWLGARTTTNPFAVQDIADAAIKFSKENGIDISSLRFLVKNPANQDLELWIGAIQRLYNAGIRRITAIHRGFSVYGDNYYRNPPQWQIPMELRRRVPNLQILSDPSHIGGRRELVETIARQAISRGFDGLIIESHPHPEKALSDSSQQVTPQELADILSNIRYGRQTLPDNELSRLRDRIDAIDDELMSLIQRRMEIAREIGDYKKSHSMTIVQPERYDILMSRRAAEAQTLGVSPDFIKSLLAVIHEESVRQQLAQD